MTAWDGGSRSPRQVTIQEVVMNTITYDPGADALKELALAMLELNGFLASSMDQSVPVPVALLTRVRAAGQNLVGIERRETNFTEHDWLAEERRSKSLRRKQEAISGQKRRMESGFAQGYREDLIRE